MRTIRQWLEELGLEEYISAFEENKIDWDLLPDLTDELLKEIGVTAVGHRIKISKGIKQLNLEIKTTTTDAITDIDPVPPEPHPDPADSPIRPQPSGYAERRQLTVMFCDLVGSTTLSEQLDPEDLRTLMQRYQETCGAIIQRYDGHVAQYLGDGLMTYFGWPMAQEDAAERAVRASLDILDAISSIDGQESLQVRVGIATGQVVVGETGAGDASVPKLAVGETPNLAARVQGLAEPNTVVIGGITRDLIGEAFELDRLGPQTLKGIAEPVEIFRVLHEKSSESRFESAYAGDLTPLVGREEEILLLLRRWDMSKSCDGQVALLCGEPGIGKSRIVRMLHEKLSKDDHTRLRYQCSPHHVNSAFYPVIQQLERAAGFERDDKNYQKLDKLETLLTQARKTPDRVTQLFASILSINLDDRYAKLSFSPQRQKEEIIKALAEQVLALSLLKPVLLIFEDTHWMDPTSLEILELLVDLIHDHPVLMVITCRPEFRDRFPGRAHVTTLTLNRLPTKDAVKMVERVTGGKPLPDEVLQQIITKTDGVPLFVEELTKTVVEGGFLKDQGTYFELEQPIPPMAIPSTIQDSLMARLDRLEPGKEIAQIGSCIGRTFSYDLLSRVSNISGKDLRESLKTLVDNELVIQRGTESRATYTFKHALIQDVAYESLLKTKRQRVHGEIATRLITEFPEIEQTEPELLAHHFTEAALPDQAVPLWLLAGQKALLSWASTEAIAHLSKGLNLVITKTPNEPRNTLELDFQVALGTALMRMYSWGSKESGAAYRRAAELCESVNDTDRLIPTLWGDFTFTLGTGNIPAIQVSQNRNMEIARKRDNSDVLFFAYATATVTAFISGSFVDTQTNAQQCHELYDPQRHAELVTSLNHDLDLTAQAWESQCMWLLGYPDQARKICDHKDQMALNQGHLFQQAWLQSWGALTYHYSGDIEAFSERIHNSLRISEEHRFLPISSQSTCYKGWVLAMQGHRSEGIRLMGEGIDAWENCGMRISTPYFRTMYSQILLAAGETNAALNEIEKVATQVSQLNERWVEPEMLRTKGEIILARNIESVKECETYFLEALQIARAQKAKSWELRASMSLARLWHMEGKNEEAFNALSPVLNWFTEGFDTADLKEAKRLVDQLH